MRKYVFCSVCMILAMIMSVSCSKNTKVRELLDHIPASADFVAVGNVKTIVESMGGTLEDSKLKIPTYIMDALPDDATKEVDETNDFLKKSGVDPEACALMVDYDDDKPVLVCHIGDIDKFINAIKGYGYTQTSTEDELVIYCSDYDYVAVAGSYAYYLESIYSSKKAQRYLENIIDDAQDKSVASTDYGDYMAEGNAGGLAIRWPKELRNQIRKMGLPSDALSIYDGIICLRSELSEDKWL